jgi:hypothetical protein
VEHDVYIFRVEGKTNQEISYLHHAGLLLHLFLDPEDGGEVYIRSVVWFCKGLHGVISQYMELFITTALKTPNV